MTQVYAVVYANGSVFVAFKKSKGERFKGRYTKPTTLNSAGQLVVPGGGLEKNETIAEGARREFFEETGLDILKYASLTEVKEFGGFGVGYYEVAEDYEWALQEHANTNIWLKQTEDDELHQVGWISISQALETLNFGFSTQFIGEDDVRTLEKRSKFAFDLGWYVKAISGIPFKE